MSGCLASLDSLGLDVKKRKIIKKHCYKKRVQRRCLSEFNDGARPTLNETSS